MKISNITKIGKMYCKNACNSDNDYRIFLFLGYLTNNKKPLYLSCVTQGSKGKYSHCRIIRHFPGKLCPFE
jgi:hypothetical protein